ncbi:MAG: hypothetical protein R2822_08785 [Spirosomataceae bacterium]
MNEDQKQGAMLFLEKPVAMFVTMALPWPTWRFADGETADLKNRRTALLWWSMPLKIK